MASNTIDFVAALQQAHIRFVAGVPDSLLGGLCEYLAETYGNECHVTATNEGSAAGLAIGHYLATGEPGLVYLQNSGLGHVLNPLISLAHKDVYSIPIILLIGWRAEVFADGYQSNDEPQHRKQGMITLPLLELMDIRYWIIGRDTDDVARVVHQAREAALEREGPVALVVRKGYFEPSHKMSGYSAGELTREKAIETIVIKVPDSVPVICTTGKASRELYEIRAKIGQEHNRDFLTVGGMGHAGQIATGIALAKPNLKVLCLEGDGAALMHLGAMVINARCKNLIYVLIRNGVHDSVGGQAIAKSDLKFTELATTAGFDRVLRVSDVDGLRTALVASVRQSGSSYIEVACVPGANPGLGRPRKCLAANRSAFMEFLEGAL